MKQHKILYVDDEVQNLSTLEAALQRIKEFDIHCSASAKDGLEWLLKNDVDLILLDIMMPEIDGFEMGKIDPSKTIFKKYPIIYVTARRDDTVVEQAFASGGNDYISKPIHLEELIARIWMQIRLLNQQRELKQKLSLIEYMIEIQSNMMVVTDGHTLIKANKPFLEATQTSSEDHFNNTYQEIAFCCEEHTDSSGVMKKL